MSQPISQYIATVPSEMEWRVLVTLSQFPSPSDACRRLNWLPELFSSSETQELFSRLTEARQPQTLSIPAPLDGISPYTQEELRQARIRMGCIAVLTRLLPTFQSNLRDRLLAVSDARVPDEANIEHLLTQMMETTLTGIDTSLAALKSFLSPTAQTDVFIATQAELDAGYWDRIRAMREAAPTGFSGLNTILSGGLHPEKFMVVLGAPGAGKTTFVHQIAEFVASRGRPVAYLACEEPAAILYAKTLSRLGNVDYAAAQFGWNKDRQQIDAARAIANERLSAHRLLYIEGFTNLSTLREVVGSHFQRYRQAEEDPGPGLLVVDYLQCLGQILSRNSGTNLNENQVLTLLCSDLRHLAKELCCSVIAISRQHRASGYGNANALTSGSGSGSIEYGADVLMCIDKDEERRAPIGWTSRVVVVPKNRLGEADTRLELNWRGSRQEFREANRDA